MTISTLTGYLLEVSGNFDLFLCNGWKINIRAIAMKTTFDHVMVTLGIRSRSLTSVTWTFPDFCCTINTHLGPMFQDVFHTGKPHIVISNTVTLNKITKLVKVTDTTELHILPAVSHLIPKMAHDKIQPMTNWLWP